MKIETYQKQITTIQGREVTVRIMTPDGYEEGEKRYPVLYVSDGQDVFRDADILWGECSMDYEAYYRSNSGLMPEFIIAAVECPRDRDERTEQYSPFSRGGSPSFPPIEGKGKAYLKWLTDELKPWVDRSYRTKAGAEDTGICGYSTGGLLAVYALLEYPRAFTRMIAMSSAVAIWMEELQKTFDSGTYSHIKYIYMDVGTNEFGRITTKEEFLNGAEVLYKNYIAHGVPASRIRYNIYPDAVHSQLEWKKRFPDALRWIFQDSQA